MSNEEQKEVSNEAIEKWQLNARNALLLVMAIESAVETTGNVDLLKKIRDFLDNPVDMDKAESDMSNNQYAKISMLATMIMYSLVNHFNHPRDTEDDEN